MIIEHPCETCGGPVTPVKPHRRRKGQGRFCSSKCYGASKKLFTIERLAEQFWAYVERTPDGCWLWKGKTNSDGYGFLTVDRKKLKAHRVAWTLINGPIPDGQDVLHSCDNPPCVRAERDSAVSHLATGTNAQNVAERVARRRSRGRFSKADAAA